MSRAEAWREKARTAAIAAAVELELPSGAVILARRPGLAQLAEWRRLPLGLVPGEQTEPSDDQVAETMAFLREMLVWCVLDPRIPEEMDPREIPEEDWTFIVRWAMRLEEVAALQGFRGERADGGAGGDGADVRSATVEPAGDGGPGVVARF